MLAVGAALCDGVEGVEDVDWHVEDYGGQKIFSIVGCKLLDQTKVDESHSVKLGVWEPHIREYLDY